MNATREELLKKYTQALPPGETIPAEVDFPRLTPAEQSQLLTREQQSVYLGNLFTWSLNKGVKERIPTR